MTNYDIIGKRVDSIACNKCGTVMDVSDAEPFSIVQCPKCGTRQPIPKKLGDFLLLQFLGKGGMGAVFQAYDTKLGRQVAIKVLGKVLGDDPAAMDNFLREARAAAQINSPYVVQIFQVGEERNKPFIVMELINGGQLDKMIEHHPLPELRALEVCRDAALGLQSAQEMGLFHGDIKPENILFDQHQTAKIADFGLAQFLQRGQHTKPGEIWGTPYYIAPEKARRQQEDYRSDIYSLGATLFHALTGQPPFEGDTAADVVLARLKNYAPSILDVKPTLHEVTAKLVARMLEPDPSMRYPNYTSLLSDIESVIQIVTRTPVRPPGEKKTGCGFWVVLFLILLGAAGTGAWFFLNREDSFFSTEQQQQLINHANTWTRNIYRFEPAALMSMDDSLIRFDASLPAEHPGKDWIPIFRATVQLLALNTNELSNTLSKLLGKDIPEMIDGEPNRALMPAGLAFYLVSTNQLFEPGPEKWPRWYRDYSAYVMGVKMLAQANYAGAHQQLNAYIDSATLSEERLWPYLFQPVAMLLSDQINKWEQRQELLDKFIARGNFDKALERLESYQVGAPPIFMAYVNRSKPKVGQQETLAQPTPTPVVNEEAIRRAEAESRKQREQAAREALKQQEEAERARREAEQAETERQHRLDVEADEASIRQATAAAAPTINQRNYSLAQELLTKNLPKLTTDEGQRDAREIDSLYSGMAALEQMVVSEVGKAPLPAAVKKMLGGEPKRADRNGIVIALAHGETVKSWDQIGNPLYIKLAESTLATSGMAAQTKAERYMALALFCQAINAPKSWVTRYADLAVASEPSLRVELDHYQQLLSNEP